MEEAWPLGAGCLHKRVTVTVTVTAQVAAACQGTGVETGLSGACPSDLPVGARGARGGKELRRLFPSTGPGATCALWLLVEVTVPGNRKGSQVISQTAPLRSSSGYSLLSESTVT